MQRLLNFSAVITLIATTLLACTAESPAPDAAAETKTSSSGTIIGYNSNTAMNLSGQLVPPDVQGYYFIEILDEVPNAEYVTEVRQLMGRAHDDQDFLGIIGRDAARLRQIVLASLAPIEPGSLNQATIVVIGRAQDESALRPAVEASGAELRFGIYIPPDTPVL